jgi:hypothetical protein
MVDKSKWRIDAVIVVVFATAASPSILHPDTVHQSALLAGLYLQFIGVLFVLSYFHPDGSYILMGLMWCCEHTSHPVRGRWTAILWGSFTFLMGLLAMLHG